MLPRNRASAPAAPLAAGLLLLLRRLLQVLAGRPAQRFRPPPGRHRHGLPRPCRRAGRLQCSTVNVTTGRFREVRPAEPRVVHSVPTQTPPPTRRLMRTVEARPDVLNVHSRLSALTVMTALPLAPGHGSRPFTDLRAKVGRRGYLPALARRAIKTDGVLTPRSLHGSVRHRCGLQQPPRLVCSPHPRRMALASYSLLCSPLHSRPPPVSSSNRRASKATKRIRSA